MRALATGFGRGLRALGAVILLAGSVGGVPWLLVAAVGWPLPSHLPSLGEIGTWLTSSMDSHAIFQVIACLAWLLWICWTASLVLEAYELARYARAPRRVPTGLQAVAAAVLTAATLNLFAPASHAQAPAAAPTPVTAIAHPPQAGTSALSTTGDPWTARPAAPGGGGADTLTALRPAAGTRSQDRAPASLDGTSPSSFSVNGASLLATSTRGGSADQAAAVGAPAPVHRRVVHDGDTLWDLAATHLGDAERWHEIYALNHGLTQADGQSLTDPDLLIPGWVLILPAPPAATTPRPPTAPSIPTPHTAPGTPGPSAAPTGDTAAGGPTTGRQPTPNTALPSGRAPASSSAPPAPARPLPDPGADATPRTPVSPTPGTARILPVAVDLPGGGWLDAGLVAGLLAAVGILWAHRQRRYRPRQPSPELRLDEPDLRPPSPTTTGIGRQLAATVPAQPPVPAPPPGGPPAGRDAPTPPRAVGQPPAAGSSPRPARPVPGTPRPVSGRPADESAAPALPVPTSPVAGPWAPAPQAPGLGGPLSGIWPATGLGLSGPGGADAARGMIASALAAGGPGDPNAQVTVVIPSAALLALLDQKPPPAMRRLVVTSDLPTALDVLEEATLTRTRTLADYNVDSPTDLRRVDPLADPLPPMLLVGGAIPAPDRTSAVLTEGTGVDIHGLLLGPWPAGRTVRVAADGTTTDPRTAPAGRGPKAPTPVTDFGRLATLSAAQLLDLLTTLAEAHSGQPSQPAAPAPSPPPQDTPVPATDGVQPAAHPTPGAAPVTAGINGRSDPAGHDTALAAAAPVTTPAAPAAPTTDPATPHPPPPAPAGPPVPAAAHGRAADPAAAPQLAGLAAESGPEVVDADRPQPAADGSPDSPVPADAPLPASVSVSVLGGIQLGPPGTQISGTVRRNSLQVLVFLIVHGGSATLEALRDDIVPDVAMSESGHHIHVAVSDLRQVLNQVGGPADRIPARRRRYELDRDTVQVDLWAMQAAIAQATAAEGTGQRIAALRRAIAYYRGPLAEGHDFEWIEAYREAVRRQVLDAHVALAEALTDSDPHEALTVLVAAITHAPYNEDLYRRAMLLYAQVGNRQAIRDLRRALTRALQDLDTTPSDETAALADRLLAQARARPKPPTTGRRKT